MQEELGGHLAWQRPPVAGHPMLQGLGHAQPKPSCVLDEGFAQGYLVPRSGIRGGLSGAKFRTLESKAYGKR